MIQVPVIEVQKVITGSLELPVGHIGKPDDAVKILRHLLQDKDREHFVILALTTKNIISAVHTVSIGSLNAAIVHPREVFKALILSNAAGFLCGHNHPSGLPNPSPEDERLTARLEEASTFLGIEMLDHIIIGDNGRYYSFREKGGLG